MSNDFKHLYRSRNYRILGGVCGGLGEYFNIDPVVVRLITVISVITGMSILIYIILWIVIPEEPVVIKDDGRTA